MRVGCKPMRARMKATPLGCVLLALVCCMWADSGAAASEWPEAVPLTASEPVMEVWPRVQALVAPDDDAGQVPSFTAFDWAAVPRPHHHFGVGDEPAWARFRVRFDGAEPQDWYVVQQQSFVDDLRLFRRDPATAAWREVEGLRSSSSGLLSGARNPAFLIRLQPGVVEDLLVRSETRSHRRFALQMVEADTYRRAEWRTYLLLGAVMMTPLVTAAFLLMLWRVQRQPQIVLMVAFILSELVGALWVGGLLYVVIPGASPRVLGLVGTFSWACSLSLAYAHARLFLHLPARMPRWNQALSVIPVVACGGFVLEVVGASYSRIVLISLAAFAATTLLMASLWQSRQRIPYAGLYSLAWSTYVVSSVLIVINLQGWIAPNISNLTLFAQGSIVSVIFAIAVLLQLRDRERDQQNELALSQKRAERTRFIVAMNHDLLQPLQAIGLLTQLLQGSPMSHEQRRWVAQLQQARTSLSDIIDSVLALSRLDSDAIEVQRGRVDLQSLLADLVDEYALVAQLKGLHLQGVPTRIQVLTDRRLLERILRNLLANSIRYSRRGRIVLGVRRRPGQVAGIQILDQGPGIPADQQRRIFLPYQRGDNPIKGDEGYGLGLSVVRGLADALEARLILRSTEGRGTCIELQLPQVACTNSRAST